MHINEIKKERCIGTHQNTTARHRLEEVSVHYLCTGGWTSSLQQEDSCRTDVLGVWGACRRSAPRSAGRSNVPPPGVRRAQASPLSPCSTAGAAAGAFAFALHPWPSAPDPPQPDPSSSGPDHTAVGISLLTHAHTMWWGPDLARMRTHWFAHCRSTEDLLWYLALSIPTMSSEGDVLMMICVAFAVRDSAGSKQRTGRRKQKRKRTKSQDLVDI